MILEVASGETACTDVDGVVVHALDAFTMQISPILFGPHFGDDAFLRLEVVEHFFCLKGAFPLLENGTTLFFAQRIDGAKGSTSAGLKVEFQTVCCQRDVIVFGFSLAVIIDFLLVHVAIRRIDSRTNHLCLNSRLGTLRSDALTFYLFQGVGLQSVYL